MYNRTRKYKRQIQRQRQKQIQKQRQRQRQRQTRVKGGIGADKTIHITAQKSALYPNIVLNRVSIHNSGDLNSTLNNIDEYIAGLGLNRLLNRDVVNQSLQKVQTLTIRDRQIIPPPLP